MGLVLIGCDLENCIGNGECIVSVEQGGYGLYVDDSASRSSCGNQSTYSPDLDRRTGGCKVQNNIDNHNRTHGTHRCDC